MKNIIKWHQYTALITLIPLFIWLGSGLALNLIDHNQHSGNELRVSVKRDAQNTEGLVSIKQVLSEMEPVVKVELIDLISTPYYLLHHEHFEHSYFKNSKTLVNAKNGVPFLLTREVAEQLALSSYSGETSSVDTQFLEPPIYDLNKERNPVWQININDSHQTSIYVRANSGEIIAHINDKRRFKDLMLRLHFLDIANNGSFNNWQNILFALILLVLSITGVVWFIKGLKANK